MDVSQKQNKTNKQTNKQKNHFFTEKWKVPEGKTINGKGKGGVLF